jgi:CBS domain-containing protein
LFLVFGLAAVWLAAKTKLKLGDVAKTALLLAPLVFYLVVSGRVLEFEGAGWKVKFRQVVTQSAITASRAVDLAVNIEEANQPDFFTEAFFGHCRPYYVIKDKTAKSQSDQPNTQASQRIASAIRASILCSRFAALIVVDDDRKPVGYFERDLFLELLHVPLNVQNANPTPDAASLFVQVDSTELGVILRNPVIRARSDDAHHLTISSGTDIGTAYKTIVAAKVSVAPLVDRLGRFDGIITRAAIEARVIEGLIEASK